MSEYILLDAGHNAQTSGHRSPCGEIIEYKTTRIIVNRLRDKLLDAGFRVFLVHPTDDRVGNTENYDIRIRRDRSWSFVKAFLDKGIKNNAYLFISVHLNAYGNGREYTSPNGCKCFISTDSEFKSRNTLFCKLIEEEYQKAGLKGNRHVLPEDLDVHVLRQMPCPSVLTENLFMTNVSDIKILQSCGGR